MTQKQKEEAAKAKIEDKGKTSNPTGNGGKTDSRPASPVTPTAPVQNPPATKPITPVKPNNKKGNDVQKIVDKKQKEKENPLPIPQSDPSTNGMSVEDIIKEKGE